MKEKPTRRDFCKGAVAALATPYLIPSAALGAQGRPPASERINIGYIGTGPRGRVNLLEQLS